MWLWCGMCIINGVLGPEPRSSGGNTSSNPQISALIPGITLSAWSLFKMLPFQDQQSLMCFSFSLSSLARAWMRSTSMLIGFGALALWSLSLVRPLYTMLRTWTFVNQPDNTLGATVTPLLSSGLGLGLQWLGANAVTCGNVINWDLRPELNFVTDDVQHYSMSIFVTRWLWYTIDRYVRTTWILLLCNKIVFQLGYLSLHRRNDDILFLYLISKWWDGVLKRIQLICKFSGI